jgi:hypothetical protein
MDANGTVSTNTYDKANRIRTKTYPNEPGGRIFLRRKMFGTANRPMFHAAIAELCKRQTDESYIFRFGNPLHDL